MADLVSAVSWKGALIAGVVLAVAGTVLGEPALSVATLACGGIGIFGLLTGSLRHGADYRVPWHALAASIALFLVAAIVHPLSPAAGNAFDGAGYCAAIVGLLLFGRLRANDRDPTGLIDALILTTGVGVMVWAFVMVPHLQDPGVLSSTKAVDVVFSGLSLALLVAVTRLAIGPGAKSSSYYLLAVAGTCALVSDVLTSFDQASHADFFGVGAALELTPALAFAALGAAALHPTMTQLTARSVVPIGRMTTARLAVMTAAVLVAPAVLMLKIHDPDFGLYASGLVAGWALIMLLVMLRMAGLVRARERLVAVERTLNRAAGRLVSATDRDQMHAAAITAMCELSPSEPSRLRVSVASRVNDGWTIAASSGYRSEAALGVTLSEQALGLSPDARAPVVRSLMANIILGDDGLRTVVTVPLVSSNQIRGALIYTLDGDVEPTVVDALGALATDVSLALETAALTEDLHRRRSEHRFKALVEHSNEIIVVLDGAGLITYCSPSTQPVLGRRAEDLLGTSLGPLVHPDDNAAVGELMSLASPASAIRAALELRIRSAAGDWMTMEVTVTDLREDPDVGGIVLNAHDVTHRKALEQDLRHQALHDDLTGLANRVLFRARVDHALARRHKADAIPAAILFVGLDDLKEVRDRLGHDLGDKVLTIIAGRLSALARGGDTVARLGGDEFAVLIEQAEITEDVMVVARRVLATLQDPVSVEGREIAISASMGIALADESVDSADMLLRNGDVAMYYAKRTGKGHIRVFDEAMYVNAFERLELKAHLAQALGDHEFTLYYQPLVALKSGEVLGFEALLRWDHPERGAVGPASFIPLAEENGLIVPIGAWVLRQAVAQLATWRRSTGRDLVMSINISPRQLEEDSIVDEIGAALVEAGVDPSCITLELTESAMLEEGASRDKFVELRRLGVSIAADDFGTGFASYAALQELPFTTVKIDRSLINNLDGTGDKALAQVRSIVQMAHATDLLVVAEGIERETQRVMLAELGCDIGQGFLLGRPAPVAAVDLLLAGARQPSGAADAPRVSQRAGPVVR
jgi:diguanylate cyclase (GGDEF)-like protein/PAS domain S-box-containing protein